MELRNIEKEVLGYFEGDTLAYDVFMSKYSNNKEETPVDLHSRMAREFARISYGYSTIELEEEEYNDLSPMGKKMYDNKSSYFTYFKYYFNLLDKFKFIIPQGSVMQGLGTGKAISLSNCFFNGHMEDNINSIYDITKSMAQIGKRRGGTSTDLSKLRPRGSIINNSANYSTGAVSWLDLIDTTGKKVGQEGRKMAIMVTMDIRHPDIEEFITIKNDLSKVTSANLSVKLNKEFKEAIENDTDFYLRFPVDSEVDITYPDTKVIEYNKLLNISSDIEGAPQYIKKVKARELWDTIIHSAWKVAEPGLLMWDNVLYYDPTSVYEELMPLGTNPCSELPLAKYDSCRLIFTNLYSLVKNPFEEEAFIDKELAYEVFYTAQVLADNIVDLEIEHVDRIIRKIKSDALKESAKVEEYREELKLWEDVKRIAILGRRTGTGINAYGDFLAALNVSFGDEVITRAIFDIKFKAELDATIDMSILRGNFPLWDPHLEWKFNNKGDVKEGLNGFYQNIIKKYPECVRLLATYGRRNSGISTIAPTGSGSILTQTTSGIEPLFSPYYMRRKKANLGETPDFIDQNGEGYMEYLVIHPKFRDFIHIKYKYSYKEIDSFSLKEVEEYFKLSPWYGQTASDIDWVNRVDIQGIIQEYISSSISSTINLPEDIEEKVVGELYLRAFNKGLKGLTVYREGSRSGILVNSSSTPKEEFPTTHAPKRPKELKAILSKIKVKGTSYAVVVGEYKGKPYEVFAFNIPVDSKVKSNITGKVIKVKKGHYRFESDTIVIDNLNSEYNNIIEKLCTIQSSMLLRHGAPVEFIIKSAKKIDPSINSFVSAISRVLSKYSKIEELECPECGEKMIKEAGCETCLSCGYSKCD